jgi:hypothetical protein
MLRHRDILQACHFTWVTDYKGLIHLVNQKNLSGRQGHWVEKILSFDFEIQYLPGTENVLADALSQIYSNEAPGTGRARSEYTYYDVVNNDVLELATISMPVFARGEAAAFANDRVICSMMCEKLAGRTSRHSSDAKGGRINAPASPSVRKKPESSMLNMGESQDFGESRKYALRPCNKAREGGDMHQKSKNLPTQSPQHGGESKKPKRSGKRKASTTRPSPDSSARLANNTSTKLVKTKDTSAKLVGSSAKRGHEAKG